MAHKQIDNLILILNGAISSSQLEILVTGDVSKVNDSKPIYAYIDSEKIEITGVSGQTLTIVRGVGGTIATTHENGVEVKGNAVCEHINELIDEKVDKVAGKELSTNDFTNAYKGQIDNNQLHAESAHAPSDANNYSHPASHAIGMITDLQTSLDAKLSKSLLTTKGDLFIRNGTDIVRLPKGTDGQVLTADDSKAVGVKWATPNVYGAEFEEDTYTPTIPFVTDEVAWQLFKEFSTQQKSIGKFKISSHLVGIGRSTSSDLRARLVIDGVQVGEEFRLESQDSGADQRNWLTKFCFVTFGTQATHAIRIEVCSSNSLYSANAHHSVIEIKRVE